MARLDPELWGDMGDLAGCGGEGCTLDLECPCYHAGAEEESTRVTDSDVQDALYWARNEIERVFKEMNIPDSGQMADLQRRILEVVR